MTRGVPTSARIANGATVEKEVPFNLDKSNGLWLGLRNPDLTTAQRIAAVINKTVGKIARVSDPRTVQLDLTNRDPHRDAGDDREPSGRTGQRRDRGHR